MKALFLAVCALALAAANAPASAATITPTLVGTQSAATGIDNVVVGTSVYNVTFSDTTYDSPFAVGTSISTNAATALTEALNTTGVYGFAAFDFPCSGQTTVTYMVAVDATALTDAVTANGNCGPLSGAPYNLTGPWSSGLGDFNLGYQVLPGTDAVAAQWALITSNVPEPPALPLFAIGLLALGLSLMRRRKALQE